MICVSVFINHSVTKDYTAESYLEKRNQGRVKNQPVFFYLFCVEYRIF